ncbi:MAG: hypothetical protein ACR2M3_19175 [Thermomicrobiales bacterium]
MMTDEEIRTWMGTGIEARIRDPDNEHADYVVTLPEFNVEAAGATLDAAINAALAKFDEYIGVFVRKRLPLPQRHPQPGADTKMTNGASVG